MFPFVAVRWAATARINRTLLDARARIKYVTCGVRGQRPEEPGQTRGYFPPRTSRPPRPCTFTAHDGWGHALLGPPCPWLAWGGFFLFLMDGRTGVEICLFGAVAVCARGQGGGLVGQGGELDPAQWRGYGYRIPLASSPPRARGILCAGPLRCPSWTGSSTTWLCSLQHGEGAVGLDVQEINVAMQERGDRATPLTRAGLLFFCHPCVASSSFSPACD